MSCGVSSSLLRTRNVIILGSKDFKFSLKSRSLLLITVLYEPKITLFNQINIKHINPIEMDDKIQSYFEDLEKMAKDF